MTFLCTWTHSLIRLNLTLRKPIHLSIIHFVRFPFTGIAFGDPGNNGRGDMTTQLEYKFPFPPVYDSYIDGNGPSALVNIFWEEIFGFDAIGTCQTFCRISLVTCVSTCKSKSIHFHVSNVGDWIFLCDELSIGQPLSPILGLRVYLYHAGIKRLQFYFGLIARFHVVSQNTFCTSFWLRNGFIFSWWHRRRCWCNGSVQWVVCKYNGI